MGLLERMLNTARGAYFGAYAGWNENALIPTQEKGWDEYYSRLARYELNSAYYSNIIYTQIAAYAAVFKKSRNLYRHIRGIYNPVSRLVDIYPAKVYGGSLDTEDGTTGAIPLRCDNPQLVSAIMQVWAWSNWGVEKNTFVQGGAQLGDVFIKIVDNKRRQRVRMEVLHPAKVRYVEFDEANNIKYAVIEYEDVDAATGKAFTYKEIITKDTFYTYKNNEPFSYVEDDPTAFVYDNPYGFIPLVLAVHRRNIGVKFGASPFHNSTRKIDELNDAGSLLNDQLRKSINFPMVATGMKKGDISFGVNDRDQAPILYIPKDTTLQALTVPLNIQDGVINMSKMQTELQDDMAELKLHNVVSSGGMSGKALEVLNQPAVDKIIEARGNYDDATIRAHMMAVTMAAVNGYEGFEAFDLNSYERGDLQHTIADRPVIDDSVGKQEKITALQTVSTQPPEIQRLILQELGYDNSVIDALIIESKALKAAELAAATAGFGFSVFGDMRNGETTAETERSTVDDSATETTDVASLASS